MDKVRRSIKLPESPRGPMEFLSRSWGASAVQQPINVSNTTTITTEEEDMDRLSLSHLVLERIMSHDSEVSPLQSGRLSHSSGPSDTPPSEDFQDVVKYFRTHNTIQPLFNRVSGGSCSGSTTPKTVGRWLKDRKEKKKEESRAHNAQVHAAVSVAAVAAAVSAVAAANAASTKGKKEETVKIDIAMASAATLVAAQCVEAAENVGAERDHLASLLSSAVNVKSHDDILTLTAAAATALRGAATLKARALKEVASVIPLEKVTVGKSNLNHLNNNDIGQIFLEDGFLAKGSELLKRTRKGDLHSKVVSVYINKAGQVELKMTSKHVAGTITKKKKNVVKEVYKDMPAWPGRQLYEMGGQQRCYFGLRTETRGVVEFECRSQRDCDAWTHGISKLLNLAAERKIPRQAWNMWPLSNKN